MDGIEVIPHYAYPMPEVQEHIMVLTTRSKKEYSEICGL